MGGSITVVCRRTDGEVFPLLRWTNPLPFFVHHIKFLTKDEEYLQKYIDEPTPWNEDDPDFQQPILPSEYGIVLLDWQNNKIISANGYTSFGSNLSTEWHSPNNFIPSPEQDNKLLYESGRIKFVYEMWASSGEPQGFSAEGMSYEEFIESITVFQRAKGRGLSSVAIDMSPFEVTNLMDSQSDFTKVKRLIEAEGIEVDPGWDAWLEERYLD